VYLAHQIDLRSFSAARRSERFASCCRLITAC
jgi:hypothetical protein